MNRPCLNRIALCLLLGGLASMSGCVIATAIGGMAESYQATGSRTVYPEYEGLRGETYAVYVVSPRAILGEYPGVDLSLTEQITRRMIQNNEGLIDATAAVPAAVVNRERYANARMNAWAYGEVAEHFGVSRLVIVDLSEMRLHEPGNRHLWAGRLAARVSVLEYQEGATDSFAFTKDITVGFPDDTGFTPLDIPASQIRAALVQRMADRVAWLFYTHEEANRIPY